MRLTTRLRPRLGTSVAMTVMSASLVVAAVRSDGYHATNVDLKDGVVWVYNDNPAREFVSRINTQTAEAESGFSASGTKDILQDGATIYAESSGGPMRLDPASNGGVQADAWPSDGVLGVGGGLGALLARDSGNVIVTTGLGIGAWKASITPTLKVKPGSLLTVSPDGFAIVVDPSTDKYVSIHLDPKGVPVVDLAKPIGADIPSGLDVSTAITAVGDRPVILDADGLVLPNGHTVLAKELGKDPALQLPGPAADSVMVASDLGLLKIDLASGTVALAQNATGTGAARPVALGKCVSAAWSTPGSFAQVCSNRKAAGTNLADFPAGSKLTFNSNGPGLVLSGPGDAQWVVRDGTLIRITNWDQAQPVPDTKKNQPDPSPTDSQDQSERVCDSKTPAAPTAKQGDLTFGAKPSGTIVIDLIGYFDDSNCDPLTVTDVSSNADPANGQPLASPVNFGQSLQFTAPNAEGPVVVSFTISDGSPEHDLQGTLTVNVVNDSSHKPVLRRPERQPRTTVQQSKTVQYNALNDWTDPDGDSISLVSATLTGGGSDGRLVFGADGLIVYSAETTTGTKTVSIVVQDEVGNQNTGTLEVIVQPPGTPIAPVARDDYATARIGQQVAVKPLLNDTDANGDLSSANVPRDGLTELIAKGLTISGPDSEGTVLLSASAAGTYIIPYFAVDATGKSSQAAIRLDVVGNDQINRPPVAVRDAVVVRVGRTVNVDVLANDTDPDGDVLAVVDARLHDASLGNGVARVVVIDRRYVRVEVQAPPATPTFTIDYKITDGLHDPVQGELKVTVPSVSGNQPPVVQPDQAVVRVNQVVSVNVLANDRDPDGDQLYITPGSVKFSLTDAPGLVWLDGTTVRYKAPAAAPSAPVIVQYQVEDDPNLSGLQPVSGTVSIRVVAADEKNQPPIPKPGELRVFTGSSATFRVPLSGIDSNGDLAVLDPNITDPPAHGTAVVSGDTIVYTAGTEPGPDQFSYTVSDQGGLTGIGIVRVVVAQGDPHSPVPINDRLRVRPGRDVSVDVLANDTDPDGDEILLVGTSSQDPLVKPTVNGKRVDVAVPNKAGTYLVAYTVNDARSQEPQQALLTIIADPTAPLLVPVTRDDPDPLKSPAVKRVVKDASGADLTVTEIKATGNDDDPDGTPDGLKVALAPGQPNDGAALGPLRAGTIRVVMTDFTQWVVYTATDPDGNTSSAVALIEPNTNAPPVCPAPDVAVATASIPDGGPVKIVVADKITDPEGDKVQLQGDVPKITLGGGTITPTQNDFSQFTYTADNAETRDAVIIAVPVEDRKGAENDRKVTCNMTIGIKRTNERPVTKDASFSVEQDTDGKTIQLGNLRTLGFAVDKDVADALAFAQTGTSSQNNVVFAISKSGDLTVTADKAPVGATLTFDYEVTDNQPSTPAALKGRIVVTVVTTKQPPPAVQSFTINDAKQGVAVSQDVSQASFNPFTSVGLKFEVEPSPASGRGDVAAIQGSTITFTPAPDFFGQAIVRFTATDKVLRVAAGTITYNIVGRPLIPGQPTVTEVSSHRAVLNWGSANPQGTPITNYIVRWPGGTKDAGTATTATIDTLSNGVPVQFTVIARNKVGDSDPSASSASVLPDQIPSKPAAPVITGFADKSLTVVWTEPVLDGTPIIRYDLYSSAGGAPLQRPATERTYTVTGLSNGTPYTFTVVAVNSAGASGRSDLSNALSPATVPSQPAAPTANDAGNGIQQRATVSWVAPADNGRPIQGYWVTDTVTGTIYKFPNDPSTTQSIPTGDTAAFTVMAINAVGQSQISLIGPTVNTPKAPGPVGTVTAASNQDRMTTLTFTPPAVTGGCVPSTVTYEYSLNGGGSWAALAGSNQIGGLNNGTAYQVQVRAKNCKYTGDPSAPVPFTPSGPPIGANISVSALVSGPTIIWSWNGTGAVNGSPITCSVSGEFTSSSCSGSLTTSPGYSSGPRTIVVQVCDAVGRCDQRSASAATGGTVSIGLGAATTTGTCAMGDSFIHDNQGCYFLSVTLSGWSAGLHVVRCFSRMAFTTAWTQYDTFNAGNGTSQGCSYSSAGRVVVASVDAPTVGGNAQINQIINNSPGTGAVSDWYGPWPTN